MAKTSGGKYPIKAKPPDPVQTGYGRGMSGARSTSSQVGPKTSSAKSRGTRALPMTGDAFKNKNTMVPNASNNKALMKNRGQTRGPVVL